MSFSLFILLCWHFWWVSAAYATRIVGDFILAGKINYLHSESNFLDCLRGPQRGTNGEIHWPASPATNGGPPEVAHPVA
jgi:hypothetical protein